MSESIYSSLRSSAIARYGRHTMAGALSWLEEKKASASMEVQIRGLRDLPSWKIESHWSSIRHQSGRFFTIEGVRVCVEDATTRRWDQPFIVQPEVGILGFICSPRDGVLHFLFQAKAEPGNPETLELSPTVQATRSNYTRAHGGRRSPLVEVFRDAAVGRIVVDSLQSEQGSRFLAKRNRNVIKWVPESWEPPADMHDSYIWLTLGQAHALLREELLINMDARTVLSCVPYHDPYGHDEGDDAGSIASAGFEPSFLAIRDGAHRTIEELESWLLERRLSTSVSREAVSLASLEGWQFDGDTIKRSDGRHFSVLGVEVYAPSREVDRWDQPIISTHGQGLCALVSAKWEGVDHYLVQARPEGGARDGVELAPTVQMTPGNYRGLPLPPFYDVVSEAKAVLFDSLLSEEGGRFFQDINRYLIVRSTFSDVVPPGYAWMTMAQLKVFACVRAEVAIELRSLIACAGYGNE